MKAFQIKITLGDINPPIWRRFVVASHYNFLQLHEVIQTVMGWDGYDAFEFDIDGSKIVCFDEDGDLPGDIVADDEVLSQWLHPGTVFTYTYGFSNCWRHTVLVEETVIYDREQPAICLEGTGACPPEDCGGPMGYAELVEQGYIESSRRFDLDTVNIMMREQFEELKHSFEPPDEELWRELFELALRVRALKPWERLSDTELISVKLPSEQEPTFFSTLGSDGECFALCAYHGYEALAGYYNIMESSDRQPVFVSSSYQDCICCYFGSRDDLTDEEYLLTKQLGYAFRGKNSWVFFRRFRPGYLPWTISMDDAVIMRDAMTEYINAFKALSGGKVQINFEDGDLLMRRRLFPGGWINEPVSPEQFEFQRSEIEITDELLLARLKKQKLSPAEIEFDMVYLPFPIAQPSVPHEPPVLPCMCVLVDFSSQSDVCVQRLIHPDEDANLVAIDVLRSYIMQYGRPARMFVRDERVARRVRHMCGELGISLTEHPSMTFIDSVINELVADMYKKLSGSSGSDS